MVEEHASPESVPWMLIIITVKSSNSRHLNSAVAAAAIAGNSRGSQECAHVAPSFQPRHPHGTRRSTANPAERMMEPSAKEVWLG